MMDTRVKYPRTPHLPWSPGASHDDVYLADINHFIGKHVVISEKMDGENTSLYRHGLHARSLDSRYHPSRDWVKALHAQVGYRIPAGWRICGENCFAQHSISYHHLDSYFLAFSVWNEHNLCLSWREAQDFLHELGLTPVPVIFEGLFDAEAVQQICLDTKVSEGYVIRSTGEFAFADFANNVAKWVRSNHVQSEQHWMHQAIKANGLRNPS